MKNNKGFSLVELIVVIAIMAILIGVAVPVYSSYVEKSQKAADIQLVDEIIHALQIAAVGDNWYQTVKPGSAVGAIVLTPDSKVTVTGNIALLEKALGNTFGWDYKEKLNLSYDGWNIEYNNSSFAGSESALLGKVDVLTEVLKSAIVANPDLVGDRFSEFLNKLAAENPSFDKDDADSKADAAVLYIAQQSKNNVDREGLISYVSDVDNGLYSKTDPVVAVAELSELFGEDSAAPAAAALYAVAEGYCRFEYNRGKKDLLDILDEATNDIDATAVTNGDEAILAVLNAFAAVQQKAQTGDGYAMEEYFRDYAAGDIAAYLDILATVDSAQNEIVDSLGQDNCFSSSAINNLFVAYSQGGVIILVEIDENGTLVIDNPLE